MHLFTSSGLRLKIESVSVKETKKIRQKESFLVTILHFLKQLFITKMLRIPCEKVTPLEYPTIPVIISLPCPKPKKPPKKQ